MNASSKCLKVVNGEDLGLVVRTCNAPAVTQSPARCADHVEPHQSDREAERSANRWGPPAQDNEASMSDEVIAESPAMAQTVLLWVQEADGWRPVGLMSLASALGAIGRSTGHLIARDPITGAKVAWTPDQA